MKTFKRNDQRKFETVFFDPKTKRNSKDLIRIPRMSDWLAPSCPCILIFLHSSNVSVKSFLKMSCQARTWVSGFSFFFFENEFFPASCPQLPKVCFAANRFEKSFVPVELCLFFSTLGIAIFSFDVNIIIIFFSCQ